MQCGFQIKNANGIQIIDEDYYTLGYSRKILLTSVIDSEGYFNGVYLYAGESLVYIAIGPVSKLPAYLNFDYDPNLNKSFLRYPTGADLSEIYLYIFRDAASYSHGYGIQLRDANGKTRFMSWLKPLTIISTCFDKYTIAQCDTEAVAVWCSLFPTAQAQLYFSNAPSNVSTNYYVYLWPTINKQNGYLFATPNIKTKASNTSVAYQTYPASKIHLPNYLPFMLIDTSKF